MWNVPCCFLSPHAQMPSDRPTDFTRSRVLGYHDPGATEKSLLPRLRGVDPGPKLASTWLRHARIQKTYSHLPLLLVSVCSPEVYSLARVEDGRPAEVHCEFGGRRRHKFREPLPRCALMTKRWAGLKLARSSLSDVTRSNGGNEDILLRRWATLALLGGRVGNFGFPTSSWSDAICANPDDHSCTKSRPGKDRPSRRGIRFAPIVLSQSRICIMIIIRIWQG